MPVSWTPSEQSGLGWQPISEVLAAARAVSSVPELLETLERLGVEGLYELFVYTDPGEPERYLVFFEQAAISLPDESYYREERFAGVRGVRWSCAADVRAGRVAGR